MHDSASCKSYAYWILHNEADDYVHYAQKYINLLSSANSVLYEPVKLLHEMLLRFFFVPDHVDVGCSNIHTTNAEISKGKLYFSTY